EEQVLHRRVDGAVVAGGRDGREGDAEPAQAGDDHHRDVGEVIRLPLHGRDDAQHAGVVARQPASQAAVDAEGPAVERAEPRLGGDQSTPRPQWKPARRLVYNPRMSLDLRTRVAVVGVGCTPFGELYDKSPEDLLCDAVDEALADAGCERQRIEAAWVGTVMS